MMQADPSLSVGCHACGAQELQMAREYESLHRVTSDCKPWPPGGKLAVCGRCGFVQAVTDGSWRDEARRIYQEYTIYHQGGGVEQSVFDPKTGQAVCRSDRLLNKLRDGLSMPPRGRLLDIGCGNGGLLRSASRIFPDWTLAGTEFDAKYRPVVEAIPRVERLYTCLPAEIPGAFDVIVMMHVLEHLTDPRAVLAGLLGKLQPGGLLFIQVPDFTQNPFELLVADHCTHFSAATLENLVVAGGFEIAILATDWTPKEISLVARRKAGPAASNLAPHPASQEDAARALTWLIALRDAARKAAGQVPFGLFGTSIAATFLYSELPGAVTFFLDEDPARAGKKHLGLPIYPPGAAPAGSHVFIPLAPALTESVAKRIGKDGRIVCHHLG